MPPVVISIAEKMDSFTELWSPKIIAGLNDCHFKLVKLQGDFVWHDHSDTDEAFIVFSGRMRIDFRDGTVTLNRGEMIVVPKGVEHKPFADEECHVLLVESAGTMNTGNASKNERTTGSGEWI